MEWNFETAEELLALCRTHQLGVGEIALRREVERSAQTEAVLLERMVAHYRAMRESIRRGLGLEGRSTSGLSGGDAARLLTYAQGASPLLGADVAKVAAYGFAVLEHSAQFGRIVATPTAGSAGIVPACLLMLEEKR
ncbi:MAG TPA: L-serine ammonia-lyase, iron-sulfur-dependent, subunit alpha, partial [Candidatus Synoicihabitans sp.]|nr:L-serine ammonia-lyase, iron-sulfur-dependent, subunit alpha [Candidatus Synoicihabitans sp.]